MSKVTLCEFCDNYFPEYDNDEGDYRRLVGYNCFNDFSMDFDNCPFDCLDCDTKCCICFERK